MTESWGADLFRGLFAAIDRTVFSLISTVYEIILQLSKVEIFGETEINAFATKIYSLLGIFMLFKVSFSFITYLVSPDQVTDKSKGAHKIILNILLVLAMIIITPTAFNKLYEVQDAILTENLIPKFLLGTEGDIATNRSYKMSSYCSSVSYAETDGDYISLLLFRPFYQPEISEGDPDLNELQNYCLIGNLGGYWGTPSRYLKANIYNRAPAFWNGTYIIDYKFFISTLVGIVVLLILVSFCFDIAVRSIKLGFLQIIAPVPIISYVDPKSGKDGMFKKWLKEVGKTWADLFVRLFALFFAVYVIKLVVTKESLYTIVGEEVKYKFWIDLLLIIGVLIFAKQLPKLLENILGIKINGGLTLNPMKKIRDQALGGKAVTGAMKGGVALAAGAGMGIAANTAALLSNAKKDGWKKAFMGESSGRRGTVRAIGTVLGIGTGGISTAIHGAHGAYKNDAFRKGVMSGLKTSVDNRDKRDKEQDADYKLSTKIQDKFRAAAGIKTEAKIRSEQLQSNISRLQAAQQSISFQQQQYMQFLDSSNIDQLSSVTVTQDADGHDVYNIIDKLGNKIKDADGNSDWNETTFKTYLMNGKFGKAITENMDEVMQYVKLQSERNALDKKVFSYMKQEKTFTQKDTEAKKSNS